MLNSCIKLVFSFNTILVFIHVGASTRSWTKNSTAPFHFWHSVFDLRTHSYCLLHLITHPTSFSYVRIPLRRDKSLFYVSTDYYFILQPILSATIWSYFYKGFIIFHIQLKPSVLEAPFFHTTFVFSPSNTPITV